MKNNNLGSSFCTQCGTCSAVCPTSAIKMVVDVQRGIYIPKLIGDTCIHCGSCFNVCPSRSVDLGLNLAGKEPENILLGTFLNCYLAHATERTIRYNSASGGLVTTLLIFALEQGLIDGALVTRMKKDNPFEPEPFIARTRDEVIEASKSKYCPVSANIALKEIIREKGKFAVVGLPCHIQGVRQAEKNNKKLAEKIVLHIGIFCSHTDSFKATEFLLHKLNIKKVDVGQISYRGEGWPGKVKITLKDGHERMVHLGDPLWVSFHGIISFSPNVCMLCNDLTNELADISVGDPWLPEISAMEHEGKSIAISRSSQGEALLHAVNSGGYIELSPMDSKAVIRSQKTFLYFKKINIKSRTNLIKLLGGKVLPCFKEYMKDSFNNRMIAIFSVINRYLSQIPILKYIPTRILCAYVSLFDSFYSIFVEKDLRRFC